MTLLARTNVHWLVTPPPVHANEKLIRPARFEDQVEDWLKNAWSVVLVPEGALDHEGNQWATARFLMPDAPHEWLAVHQRFTLFDGPLAIADVRIDEFFDDPGES